MEGGNNAINPSTGRADFVDDLSLLTTRVDPTGALLTTTGDTSAAAALAARYAALIWAEYPNLWPESIRAILVHSARWTDAMLAEFPGNTSNDRESRLRCYGHGELEVRMRVTLSYFIEPSPGRRGWTRNYRYQSHGLRFEVKRPLETDSEFRKRVSRAARGKEEQNASFGSDDRSWAIGSNLRVKGSVHSDTWTGTAAELADCGLVAVFPVTGWWRERAHLNRWNGQARYALIVTIETDSADVDVYTPIATQIGVPVETVIETWVS